MLDKLDAIERRFVSIEESLAQPDIASKQLVELTKERADLEEIVAAYREYRSTEAQLQDTQEVLEGDDLELRDLAREELDSLKSALETIRQKLTILMLPSDPNDKKNVILEIRAGTGGDEAAIFAADLFRMYSRYAETHRWKVEIMSSTESSLGGVKEIVCLISGERVYSRLKFEMGVHRVQRVPETESQGRIHTSACTVAILPEVEDVEVDINPADLRIDTYRSSGSGGQHVNTTDSAVRITHLPTGTVAECQDERSQHKNKDKAMKMLRSRIYEKVQRDQEVALSADRKKQVGSGDRSERIRTYNFPQGRMTDHRINLTLYKLDEIINGNLDEVLDALGTYHTAQMLEDQQGGF